MYTVNITQIQKEKTADGAVAVVTFEYLKDGVVIETLTERISDPNSIKTIAQEHINVLSAPSVQEGKIDDLISTNPVGVLDLTPPPPSDEFILQQKLQKAELQKRIADVIASPAVDPTLVTDIQSLSDTVVKADVQTNAKLL